ncbi:MAG: FAD-dependent oxidoreductase, partial [Proteobacteria bacterium]|nr:FAD-dependent oxidoreductase [Pseudomonadota bacterium]
GLALNMGYTVRGMEFALASGRMAAEAVIEARATEDFSEAGLAGYPERLRESFVWRYLEAFRDMPRLLENSALFERYPQEVCRLLADLVRLEKERPGKVSAKVWGFLRRNALNWRDLKALAAWRKL